MIVTLRALQLPTEKQSRRDRRRGDGHLVQVAGQKHDGAVFVAASFSGEQLFYKLVVRDVCVNRIPQPAIERRSSAASIIRPTNKQVPPDTRGVANVILVVEQLIDESFPLIASF